MYIYESSVRVEGLLANTNKLYLSVDAAGAAAFAPSQKKTIIYIKIE